MDSRALVVLPRPPAASRRLIAWGAALAAAAGLTTLASVLAAGALGVLAAALCAQGWLGLRGHRIFDTVSLTIEPDRVLLGGQLDVKLDCSAAAPVHLERLVLHLRCHEKAIRREGSSELAYVKQVFDRTVLLAERASARPGESLAYRAKLKVPADRSATFAARNHFVDWSVVLEVEANRCPATVLSWPVRVEPEVLS